MTDNKQKWASKMRILIIFGLKILESFTLLACYHGFMKKNEVLDE